jgi:hypothetical protein
MDDHLLNKIISIITIELSIDKRIRNELKDISSSLTIDKKKKLELSIEIIENKQLKSVLNKIMSELNQLQNTQPDESILSKLAQSRIDEILEYNLKCFSEKDQKEIEGNLNKLEDFRKNLREGKY